MWALLTDSEKEKTLAILSLLRGMKIARAKKVLDMASASLNNITIPDGFPNPEHSVDIEPE